MYAAYLRLDVWVWDSDRTVVRAAAHRLKASARRDPAQRDARKRYYRQMLDHHRDAQALVRCWRL